MKRSRSDPITLLVEGPRDAALEAEVARRAPRVRLLFAPTPAECLRGIGDADVFFGRMTPELLRVAHKVRWVHSPTIGLEDVMFPALVEHRLVLTHPRGIYNEDIADHVMGFVLCFARGFHQHVRNQERRRWAPMTEHRVRHLPDSTMGIVGLGGIGGAVAIRARAAGMRVVAVDPARRTRPRTVARLWKPDRLDELLGQSDFVVICAPETPETRGSFDERALAAMKAGSVLVNVGRGSIVRLDALVDVLRRGHLAGAGLDVFEQEPLPARHPLWKMPNVVITPHMAGLGPHVFARRRRVFVDNLVRFAAGRALRGIVDKARWY